MGLRILAYSLTAFLFLFQAPSGFTKDNTQLVLKEMAKANLNNKTVFGRVKSKILNMSGKAVPALVQVMKSSQYSDRARWVATFLLGKIMGKKATPFIATFTNHPNWVLRMAALKTLLALKQKQLGGIYAKALTDKSMMVRALALDIIGHFKLTNLSQNVWKMLFDKKNYHIHPKKKTLKRTQIIKRVIRTLGDLEYRKSKKALITMIKKDKYSDLFPALDYALTKITKKKINHLGPMERKKYWAKLKS